MKYLIEKRIKQTIVHSLKNNDRGGLRGQCEKPYLKKIEPCSEFFIQINTKYRSQGYDYDNKQFIIE